MKKVYIVYGDGEYYFFDKESAYKFKDMQEGMRIGESVVYENLEDYKNYIKETYQKMLQSAIKKTEQYLDEFKSGYLQIWQEKYYIYSKDIEYVLKNKQLPKEVFYNERWGRTEISVTVKQTKEFKAQYLDKFISLCKEELMNYKKLKNDLENYKAELEQLQNKSTKNSTNESTDVQ